MNPTGNAVNAGLRRGWIEFRQTLTNGQDLWNYLFLPIVTVVVLFLMDDAKVPGTDFSLGANTLPGILGMSVVFSGMMGAAASLTVDREDGTLLRAKATPNGMIGYLVGRTTNLAIATIAGLLIILIPGVLMYDSLEPGGPAKWLALFGIVVLALLATLPVGAVIGSLGANPANIGLLMLPIMAMVGISGIFYPITALPGWLEFVGQLFPMYWAGLGMRWALLPDAMVAAELGGSWRHLEMVAVLGVWSIIGFALAPIILRRMARRESGSNLAARRQRAMQRVS